MFFDIILALPFVVLLLSIALMPFFLSHWWHKNYPKLVLALSAIILFYYLIIETEPTEVLHTTHEYLSFICLLFSLFVVSGGIFLGLKGKSTPFKNVTLLLIGAVISNLFGTTGAAMLLIRSFISFNKYRIKPFHIIFFIFIVCNVGGSLTPIGDPPLFLGYLRGVPFFWVSEHLIYIWGVTIAYLLLLFFIIDYIFYRKIPKESIEDIKGEEDKFTFEGWYNILFLFGIIIAVFIPEPIFMRELIMLACAFLSYKLTPDKIHKRNNFNFEPIKEVAILFFGIFITMIPALSLLSENAENLGLTTPGDFYWITGFLTSFLDNAPTYLNFLTVSMGLFDMDVIQRGDVLAFTQIYPEFLVSISVSAVFFGAMTYIGNGPNFMVKSIADYSKVKMPSFLEYIYKYSLLILLPFYFILWYFLFR
jgi:Na+/H+ antiporter NhaD/arsenite permease-like protein